MLIIFLLFAIYIFVLVIIFEFYYKPDVLNHFKEELESVHAFRTSNMTVSIASRFEAFDRLTSDNVGKITKLLTSTYDPNFNHETDLPFHFKKELYEVHCTRGVPNDDQYKMRNFKPLWDNMLKLKLGVQTNLEIYSIQVLFKN